MGSRANLLILLNKSLPSTKEQSPQTPPGQTSRRNPQTTSDRQNSNDFRPKIQKKKHKENNSEHPSERRSDNPSDSSELEPSDLLYSIVAEWE